MYNQYVYIYVIGLYHYLILSRDQRIVRDVNMSCQEWSTLMSKLIVTPFTIVYYSYQCFVSTTPLGPAIIYVYFIGGTIINRFLMSPVIRTTITREKREGNFRFTFRFIFSCFVSLFTTNVHVHAFTSSTFSNCPDLGMAVAWDNIFAINPISMFWKHADWTWSCIELHH